MSPAFTQVWGANELDSTCKRDSDLAANAGTCPISCQDDVACLIVACSDCALVDVACDEAIDTAAYPELARHVGGDVDSYDDLDIEDVPADKIVRLPYGAVWKSTSVSGAAAVLAPSCLLYTSPSPRDS